MGEHLSAAKCAEESMRVCISPSRRRCLPALLLVPNQALKRGKFISPGYIPKHSRCTPGLKGLRRRA